ncbi:DUF4386 domain-containing protein [Telluribacter sp. SYSU D00476]|uniref:DUF4386 domain-containing protein n=1 Tax=Telluribacter sp. SYSU D00476 TaxID=2811430 RepID=UPI001FF16188|nr:DUF4386 domain-containing protein [Telluribacter sp. SYSU D00476]
MNQAMSNMNTIHSTPKADKTNALVTGLLFLLAAITSIAALKLYEPILFSPQYLLQGAANAHQIHLAALLELLTVATVAGTGIMLYPYLRRFNESLGLGYLCFRLLEAILILVGVVSVLALLTLSQSFAHAAAPDAAAYQTSGTILKAIHDWTFMLGPNFMLGINTFLYSLVFYHSGLVPRKIALMGLAGSIFIFIASLLEMFGIIAQLSVWGMLLALPVFAYEMTLAVWLLIKGFNPEALSTRQTGTKSLQESESLLEY